MSSDSTRGLLDRARSGDSTALASLFDQIRSRLESRAAHGLGAKLRARLRASDLIQSTYLTILREFSQFQGEDEDTFSAWAATILERQMHRKARYFGARKRLEPSQPEAPRAAYDHATPSVKLARAENLTLVMSALEALPESLRQLIVWRAIEDRSYEEIAAVTGATVPALRTLFWRARAALAMEVKRRERRRGGLP